MELVRVTKCFEFEAAHLLPNHNGLCHNIHGHSYKLEVTLKGKLKISAGSSEEGMVLDFGHLKKIVNEQVIRHFDHALVLPVKEVALISEMETRKQKVLTMSVIPTCENMMLWMLDKLRRGFPEDITIARLKLQETSGSYAEWFIEDNS